MNISEKLRKKVNFHVFSFLPCLNSSQPGWNMVWISCAPFKFKRVEISIIIKKYEYFDEKSKESIFAQLIILNERRKSRKLFELFSIETKIILHQFRTFSCESARAPWAPPSSENKRWLTCFTKCLWFNIYYNSMAFKANVCLILREWEKTERKLCVSTAAALTLERIWFNNVICLIRCRHSAPLHIIFYFFLKSYPSVSFGTLMCCPSSGWCRGRSCYFIIASLHRSPSLVLPLFISHSCYVISLSSVYRCRHSICVIATLFQCQLSVVELLFLLWNIVQIALSPQLISPGRKNWARQSHPSHVDRAAVHWYRMTIKI